MKHQKKLWNTLIKIGVTLVLLYFVFTKIPVATVKEVLYKAKPLELLLALIFFVLSQIVSSERLWGIMHNVQMPISRMRNYQLYLIGMFYNFFIPGGIGGDAYKIYVLNKEHDWAVKKLSAAVLFDRLTGLLAIGVISVLLCLKTPYFTEHGLLWLVPVALVLGIGFFYFFTKKVFPSYLKSSPRAILLSLAIQGLQVLSIIYILKSISNLDDYIIFALVFLVSSALSVLSFAGIGIRELIFLKAGEWLSYDTTTGVTVGLVFTLLTAFVSLFGIVEHLRKR